MMKKRYLLSVITIFICIIVMFTCSSCKSKEERALEEAQQKQSELNQAYENAVENKNRLDYLVSEYNRLQAEIDSLPEGSYERSRAIAESNEIAEQLLDEYPELREHVSIEY